METAQNQFLFAGIDIDVAHGKNTRDGCLEFFRIHDDLLAIDFQTPIGDRTKFGSQTLEDEQVIKRHTAYNAVITRDADFCEFAVLFFKT